MSDTIQYISLGLGVIAFAYTGIQHIFHKSTNKNNEIQHTIKYQNLDQNIQNIKDLFQKLVNSNLFASLSKDAGEFTSRGSKAVSDVENQVKNEVKLLKSKVENIVTYEYDKIKEAVQSEKVINRQTITKVSNALARSQNVNIISANIQDHINHQTEQALKDDRVSIYQLK